MLFLGPQLREPLEGQRPHGPREEDGEEVADGVGDVVALEDEVEQRLGALHDYQQKAEAHRQLDDLGPPLGGLGVKPDEAGT